MAKQHTPLIIVVATLMAATMAVLAQTWPTQTASAQTAASQTSGPSMTVSPQSGVRPLTVVVTGSQCATTEPPTGVAPDQIRVSWQLVDAPWTTETRIIADGQDGGEWTTTLVLNGFDVGVYLIEANCFDAGGQTVLAYPDQKVEVLLVPPVLTGSPTSIRVGEALTATADQCPDPQGPILGGGYFVRFTLEVSDSAERYRGTVQRVDHRVDQSGRSRVDDLHVASERANRGKCVSSVCVVSARGTGQQLRDVCLHAGSHPGVAPARSNPNTDSNRYAATNCHTGANADTRAEPNASAHPDS